MKWLYFLPLIYSLQLLADCRFSDGHTIHVVPESGKLSLFDKGKSLSTHKVQDQDGLGTCYANATSAVLKSILPGKPDISYLHAAVSESTQEWDKKYIKKDSDFTNGGYMCNTIAGLKKHGGACPKSLSLMEKNEFIDPYVQAKLLTGLGKYFDSFNDTKKDPSDHAVLKQEMALAIEFIRAETSNLKLKCEERKKKDFPVERPLKRLLSPALSYYTEFKNGCNDQRLKRLKAHLTAKTVISKDRLFVEPTPEVQESFMSVIHADPEAEKLISTFINAEDYDDPMLNKLGKILGKKFGEFTSHLSGADEKADDCKDKLVNPILMGGEVEILTKNFLIDMRDDKKADCADEIKEVDAKFMLLTANESSSCIAPARFEQILDAILPLAKIGAILDKNLKSNLENGKTEFANQITNAIMPGCLQKKNLIKLDNVSCASFPMCAPGKWKDYSNSTYLGPKDSCYEIGKAKSMVRMKAISSLNNGRAMGVEVCTAFMNDPKARTNYCRNKLPGIEGHSYHEMSISGYRCQGGKIEYEILNSWGNACPAADGKKNEAIECDQNKWGQPNGRFWVKEDVLVDSMVEITNVSLRK